MSTTPTVLSPGLYSVPQPPPPPLPVQITKIVIPGVQMGSFTSVWGVGRSEPTPNPPVHGSVTQVPGSPSVFNFSPAKIVNSKGQPASDNLYNFRDFTDQVDLTLLAKATQFSNSMWLELNQPVNSQAVELDFPLPSFVGTMGLQFFPTSSSMWQVRAFDFNKKSWVALPGTSFPAALLVAGTVVGGTYTCDGKIVVHTSVTVGNNVIPVSYTQPCGVSRALSLKAAFQLDATGDAKAYITSLNKFQITFQ